jgi:drug/metabolite transporter (DMT)-like permease
MGATPVAAASSTPGTSDTAALRLHSSVLIGALCLSVSAILVKLADVDAVTTAFLRCALAVVVLLPLAAWEGRRRGPLSLHASLWCLAAGVALGIDYTAWTASIYDVGAGISTVLINVQVIVLPVLALVVDRERIPRRFVAATPLLLGGVVLVGGIGSHHTVGDDAVSGTLLGLLAGVGYGSYLYLTRRGSRGRHTLLLQPLVVSTAVAALTTAAISPAAGGLRFDGIGLRSWVELVLLAVLGQVIAWLFVNHASVRLPATTTAGLLLTQPVLALGLAAAVLAEYPGPLQSVGAVLVLVGVAIANRVVGAAAGPFPRLPTATRRRHPAALRPAGPAVRMPTTIGADIQGRALACGSRVSAWWSSAR